MTSPKPEADVCWSDFELAGGDGLCDGLSLGAGAELSAGVLDVGADGGARDAELLADLRRRQTVRDQPEHLSFAGAQQLGHQRRGLFVAHDDTHARADAMTGQA